MSSLLPCSSGSREHAAVNAAPKGVARAGEAQPTPTPAQVGAVNNGMVSASGVPVGATGDKRKSCCLFPWTKRPDSVPASARPQAPRAASTRPPPQPQQGAGTAPAGTAEALLAAAAPPTQRLFRQCTALNTVGASLDPATKVEFGFMLENPKPGERVELETGAAVGIIGRPPGVRVFTSGINDCVALVIRGKSNGGQEGTCVAHLTSHQYGAPPDANDATLTQVKKFIAEFPNERTVVAATGTDVISVQPRIRDHLGVLADVKFLHGYNTSARSGSANFTYDVDTGKAYSALPESISPQSDVDRLPNEREVRQSRQPAKKRNIVIEALSYVGKGMLNGASPMHG